MNDPVEGLIVHLDHVPGGPCPAGDGQVAQGGGAGGEGMGVRRAIYAPRGASLDRK